jgi:hypothetical protein
LELFPAGTASAAGARSGYEAVSVTVADFPGAICPTVQLSELASVQAAGTDAESVPEAAVATNVVPAASG